MPNRLLSLPTEQPGIYLEELTEAEAPEFSELTRANYLHLTQHGETPFSVSPTTEAAAVLLKGGYESENVLEMGIFEEGILVGCIGLVTGLLVPKGSAEVGYWLSKDHQGKGYATAAVKAIGAYASGIYSPVFADVARTNQKSINVLRRAGFEPNGIGREAKLRFELPKV